jgi:methyl-accepting chemotaxis protein
MGLITKLGVGSLDLKPKLIGSFVVVALLVAVTGAVGYQSVSAVDNDLDSIVENDVEKADASMEMKFQLESQRLALHEVITGEQSAAEDFRESTEAFEQWHGQLTARDDLSDEEVQLLDELATEHEEAVVTGEAVIAAMENGDTELANQRMDELDSTYTEMEEDTLTFEENADSHMAASVAEAHSTTTNAQLQVIGLAGIAFVIAVGIGLLFNRHITPPLKQLSDSAAAISDGDLQTEINSREADDEIGLMLDSFTRMQDNLNGVFDNLGTVSRSFKNGKIQQEIETEYPCKY